MLLTPDESPTGEYERRLAERRSAAEGQIRDCWGWWLIGHPVLAVVLCGGFASHRSPGALLGGITCLWCLYLIPALVATITVARNWPVLSWDWRTAGLAQWIAMTAEASVFLGMRTL